MVAARQALAGRLPALDVWRGAVVAFMAVDHAAKFMGLYPPPEGMQFFGGVTRPVFPDALAWFTRFITHYCAPAFVFLAGASVVLLAASRAAKGVRQTRITLQLVLRGLVLIALEYTVVRWGWDGPALFQVIACIGACLVLGSVLRFAPGPSAWLAGFVLLFAHPFLGDADIVPWLEDLPRHWRQVLLEPGIGDWPSIYPVIPWLAVFTMGVGWGKGLVADRERALRRTRVFGIAFLVLWLAIRLTDGFAAAVIPLTDGYVEKLGTVSPFAAKRGWMDFFMMGKYPPAADFVLWNLGGGLLFCWWVARRERAAGRVAAPLRVFGRVALFFYVAHLFLYRHLVSWLVGPGTWLGLPTYGKVWVVWVIGLVAIWPACWVFGWLKRRFPGFPLDLF